MMEQTIDARIGLLLPPPNVVMEGEFNHWLPPAIALHTTRMFRSTSDVTIDSLKEMASHANEAARLLAMTIPDVIMFGCTSGSLIMGMGWDKEISAGITQATGVPAVTTSTAVVSALQASGVRRVAIATPYVNEVNLRERSFLEGHGFQVLGIRGLEIVKSEEIGRVPLARVRQFALECDHPEADALFISCTNLRTMGVIDQLEQELGKPVITSNQASLWMCLSSLGGGLPLPGGGHLLEGLAPQPRRE